MARLKLRLPQATETEGEQLPAELRWDAPPPERSPLVLLSRRQFLKAAAVTAAAVATSFGGVGRAWARARGRFFTRHERMTLEALCDRIIPPDRGPDGRRAPGAKAFGAAVYIETLLTAFDDPRRPPRIFAGGPFSNRNLFANTGTGTPGLRHPPNDLRDFLPLTRLQELRWRAELFGSDQVPGAAFNDAALGLLRGLRPLYQDGLRKVDEVAQAMAGAPFARLSTAERDRVLGLLDRGAFARDPRRGATFMDVLIGHTLEGCLGLPEYGGNRRRRGWSLVGLEGDSQPLGFSIFSTADGAYHDRPDGEHPMMSPNPDELDASGALVPRPLSAPGTSVQTLISTFANAASGQ